MMTEKGEVLQPPSSKYKSIRSCLRNWTGQPPHVSSPASSNCANASRFRARTVTWFCSRPRAVTAGSRPPCRRMTQTHYRIPGHRRLDCDARIRRWRCHFRSRGAQTAQFRKPSIRTPLTLSGKSQLYHVGRANLSVAVARERTHDGPRSSGSRAGSMTVPLGARPCVYRSNVRRGSLTQRPSLSWSSRPPSVTSAIARPRASPGSASTDNTPRPLIWSPIHDQAVMKRAP